MATQNSDDVKEAKVVYVGRGCFSMICPSCCGRGIHQDSKFCSNCGIKLNWDDKR